MDEQRTPLPGFPTGTGPETTRHHGDTQADSEDETPAPDQDETPGRDETPDQDETPDRDEDPSPEGDDDHDLPPMDHPLDDQEEDADSPALTYLMAKDRHLGAQVEQQLALLGRPCETNAPPDPALFRLEVRGRSRWNLVLECHDATTAPALLEAVSDLLREGARTVMLVGYASVLNALPAQWISHPAVTTVPRVLFVSAMPDVLASGARPGDGADLPNRFEHILRAGEPERRSQDIRRAGPPAGRSQGGRDRGFDDRPPRQDAPVDDEPGESQEDWSDGETPQPDGDENR